jgi:hypothetical protein
MLKMVRKGEKPHFSLDTGKFLKNGNLIPEPRQFERLISVSKPPRLNDVYYVVLLRTRVLLNP